MKTRKALLAERLATERVIQSIESRAQSSTLKDGPNGSICVSMPITPGDLKQLAHLRGKLAASDALLGIQKARSGRAIAPADLSSSTAMPELLTEQMLALRWHCSTSRLQRWRADRKGPDYLKIGGKVLYRLEDVRKYEIAHIVHSEIAA